jgi:deazaflavin-dependent oxidoreductase (nitroreductase family)
MSVVDEVPWIKDHIELYKRDPERAHFYTVPGTNSARPSLLLTTVGWKSGARRETTLFYAKVDGKFILVASLGGAPDHPAWYKNLVANPEAEIQVGKEHYVVHAREAKGEERKALFQVMIDVWPTYADYERKTRGIREIPVVVLEANGQ